jgi:hypothetical protein
MKRALDARFLRDGALSRRRPNRAASQSPERRFFKT